MGVDSVRTVLITQSFCTISPLEPTSSITREIQSSNGFPGNTIATKPRDSEWKTMLIDLEASYDAI